MTEETDFFDTIADKWDSRENAETIEAAGRFIKRAGVTAQMRVLDVGAGTGILTPFLTANGARFTAIDSSRGMAAVFRKKFPAAEIITGDYAAEIFPKASFDRILFWNAFPHFQDKGAVIKKAFAELKAGGQLLIAHSMTRQELARIHGGSPEVSDDLIPYEKEFARFIKDAGFSGYELEETPAFFLRAVKDAR